MARRPPAEQLRRVVGSYQGQIGEIRRRVVGFVQRTWTGLDQYRDGDIDRFVAAVVPIVTAGQVRVAALTDAYLATLAAAVFDTKLAPVGVPAELVTDETIRGVPAADVYRRAGVTVWTRLSQGVSLTDAVAVGGDRATAMAATDLQLAKTHASRYVLSATDNVVGYRRVLESGNPCGLCIVAATQKYSREDLLPIHANCDCSVQPIYGIGDPGPLSDLPDDTTSAIGDRFSDVADSADPAHLHGEIVVHEHGELGPVLAVRGQEFTGPSDI